MKIITITCDHCDKKLGENHKMLGSENGKHLEFRNKTKDSTVQTLSRYRDLHFCSKEHFINYFFEPRF